MWNVAQSSCLELNASVFHRICPGLPVFNVVRSRCKGRNIYHGYPALRWRALQYRHILMQECIDNPQLDRLSQVLEELACLLS